MVPKQDQQRVKALLTDAITILCKNGLPYKSEFCIEGLLGITLDNHDIVLINIKETIKSVNHNSSPNSKDPLAPLDLMVLNSVSLNDVQSTIGEDLSMKNTSLTSTPGKKHNTSICSYLDKLDASCDTGMKGDNSWNFALNYALYDDVIEDLSVASGKRFQGLSMDDLSVFDNDMGEIIEKTDMVKDDNPAASNIVSQKTVIDKVACMKQETLSTVSTIEPMDQAETLDLSIQEVIKLASVSHPDNNLIPSTNGAELNGAGDVSQPLENGGGAQAGIEAELPLNLSEPEKKRVIKMTSQIKKKIPCAQCKKSFRSEASLNKHKCKAQGSSTTGTSETTQPLDLTVGRIDGEDGTFMVGTDAMVNMESVFLQQHHHLTTEHPLLTAESLNNNNDEMDSMKENSLNEVENPQELPEKLSFENANEEGNQDMYVCICNKSLPDYDAYLDHMALCPKSRQTPYKSCEVCGKYLFSSSGYVKHKRLHMGAFKFWCNVCQKGFFDRTHLNAHVDASHSKVRRYVCTVCDKKFFWKHHLKRHLVTCNGSRSKSSANKTASSAISSGCSRTSPSLIEHRSVIERTVSDQDALSMNLVADC